MQMSEQLLDIPLKPKCHFNGILIRGPWPIYVDCEWNIAPSRLHLWSTYNRQLSERPCTTLSNLHIGTINKWIKIPKYWYIISDSHSPDRITNMRIWYTASPLFICQGLIFSVHQTGRRTHWGKVLIKLTIKSHRDLLRRAWGGIIKIVGLNISASHFNKTINRW